MVVIRYTEDAIRKTGKNPFLYIDMPPFAGSLHLNFTLEIGLEITREGVI